MLTVQKEVSIFRSSWAKKCDNLWKRVYFYGQVEGDNPEWFSRYTFSSFHSRRENKTCVLPGSTEAYKEETGGRKAMFLEATGRDRKIASM